MCIRDSLDRDNDAEALVIHYGHGFTVVQLLNAAQLTCEDAVSYTHLDVYKRQDFSHRKLLSQGRNALDCAVI